MTTPYKLFLGPVSLAFLQPRSRWAFRCPRSSVTHAAAGGLVLAVGIGFFALGLDRRRRRQIRSRSLLLWFGFALLLDFVTLSALMGGASTLLTRRGTLPLPPFVTGWRWLIRLHDFKMGIPYGIALAAAALFISSPHADLAIPDPVRAIGVACPRTSLTRVWYPMKTFFVGRISAQLLSNTPFIAGAIFMAICDHPRLRSGPLLDQGKYAAVLPGLQRLDGSEGSGYECHAQF